MCRRCDMNTSAGAAKPQIFISHASRDKNAADLLVELVHGMEAGLVDVFCSSTPGYDIPAGAGFFQHISEVLGRSSLVVQLITPAFLRSDFCMLETGAAWAQGKSFPLVGPPLTLDAMAGSPLSGLRLRTLTSTGLDELRDRIAKLTQGEPRTLGWTERRDRILRDIRGALDRSSGRPISRLAALGVRGHHLEVWALNEEKRISHSWWPADDENKVWNEPYDFAATGGIVDLAVASRGPEHAEVFAIDERGELWHRWWQPNEWSGWHNFGSRVAPPIAACSFDDGHLEVFVWDTATNSLIHRYSWGPGDWSEWVPLAIAIGPGKTPES